MTIRFLYDLKLRRPACPLLQATAGGAYLMLRDYFSPSTWLTSPTPDMVMISGSGVDWRRLAQLDGDEHGRG